ncbi:MAG: hypothetical protein Q9227_002787 [Pyrenula ochraceoflavens]
MVSLLLIVFLIQLLIHLINTIGASTINELLWLLYQKLPLQSSALAADQLRLRREVLRLKQEMKGISSQDEFARWARVRRQHDRAQGEYDQKSEPPPPPFFPRKVVTLGVLADEMMNV